jgi:WD40 repeat protein
VTESGLSTPESRNGSPHDSPFLGLGYYTEADAKWFFGRATERKIILAHLRTARLTLLYAESGVGKSSLLRAGVAARLRELATQKADRHGTPRFFPVVFSAWRDDPVEDLVAEIGRVSGAAGVDDSLASAITSASAALEATLVVILDQFEEHFSYRLSANQPDRLAYELAACINATEVPANFMIAVREDTYGRLGDLFAGRIGNVYNNYLHLEYLTRSAARDAIEKPVEIYNAARPDTQPVSLEPGLCEAVLDQVTRGRLDLGGRRRDANGSPARPVEDEIETPFLQLVMTRLWDYERARGSHVLRRATLDDELGGAEAIVRSHVDLALAGLAGDELQTATDMFHDLVTPSGVKVAHTAADLAQMSSHPEESVSAVLRRLYDERIVRAVDPAPGTALPRYEIYHDRLATPILDWRRQQENARLEQARQAAEIEAGAQRTQARRFKRRARIMLGLSLSLLVLLVAVVVLLQYARDQSTTARRERRQAIYSGLTTQAQAQLKNRPDVSLLLYLAAYHESPQRLAERSIVATLQGLQRFRAIGILHGHTDAVQSVAFSPDGDTLASASTDRTIRLWTVSHGEHQPLGSPLRAGSPLYSVAFDPSGTTLATGGVDDVGLWSVARRALLATIPDASGSVNSVAFSPRGETLAAGGSDGTVLVWNRSTHRATRLRDPVRGPVRTVTFSPDGRTLAAAAQKGIVLWDTATLHQLSAPLRAPTGRLYSVAFSPDGKTIAATGSEGSIFMWNATTLRRSPREISGGASGFDSIAFSRDGRYLAAGGSAPTTLWRLGSRHEVAQRLSAQHGTVYSVAFDPRGDMLAAGGADRTVTLWSYPVGRRFGVPLVVSAGIVNSVAVSPDDRLVASTGGVGASVVLTDLRSGRRVSNLRPARGGASAVAFAPRGGLLAVASFGGLIQLWSVPGDRPLGGPLRGHVGEITSIAFNPTGTELVSGGVDGTVRLWDIRTHREVGSSLPERFGAVYSVAVSPDGSTVAAGTAGRAIELWNAATQRPLDPPLIAEDDATFSLAFSPDGRLLAAGGADDAVRLWAVRPHGYVPVGTLTGDTNYIRAVAFSPDGATLASGSTDNSIRLWDVASGTELGSPLTADTQSVESLAFTHDGQFFLSGSRDRTVRLWQAVNPPSSFAALHDRVCDFLGASLSRAEWSEYAPNIPYQPTCPRATPS